MPLNSFLCVFFQFSHLAWVQTERKDGGLGDLNYPLISDMTKSISKAYNVLIPDQVCGRLLYYCNTCSMFNVFSILYSSSNIL